MAKTPVNDGVSFRRTKGWDEFGSATDVKKFKRTFQRHRKAALDSIARDIMKEAIEAGGFEPNSALTKQIKSGSTPIKDRGGLTRKGPKGITTRNVTTTSIFVGVLESSPSYKQYVSVHEGATLKVTDKMRSMFQALAQVSKGEMQASQLQGRAQELYKRTSGPWYPLTPSTTAIHIKGRPFMTKAFGSPEAKQAAVTKMLAAVDRTFQELAGKAKAKAAEKAAAATETEPASES